MVAVGAPTLVAWFHSKEEEAGSRGWSQDSYGRQGPLLSVAYFWQPGCCWVLRPPKTQAWEWMRWNDGWWWQLFTRLFIASQMHPKWTYRETCSGKTTLTYHECERLFFPWGSFVWREGSAFVHVDTQKSALGITPQVLPLCWEWFSCLAWARQDGQQSPRILSVSSSCNFKRWLAFYTWVPGIIRWALMLVQQMHFIPPLPEGLKVIIFIILKITGTKEIG